MEITVALDGEKKRDLRFFAGDDMSLTIVVYEHDGDVTPITVTDVRFAAADGSLPMDAEFVVPSNFFGRVNYRIVGEVEDITTTLAYGVMQTEGEWPTLFCGCSGSPWPYGIVGKADNITVLDANQNFESPVSVEGALQELGDFKKSAGDIDAAVDAAQAAAVASAASAVESAAAVNALAAPDGAENVGTTAGTVQSDLNARPTTAALAAADGATWVGFQQAGAGTVPQDLEDVAREVLSVANFGAIGDGVADDTAAILAAVDFALTNVRDLHFVAGKTYRITGEIDFPKKHAAIIREYITFDGHGCKIFLDGSNFTGFGFTKTGGGAFDNANYYLIFKNFNFTSVADNGCIAIRPAGFVTSQYINLHFAEVDYPFWAQKLDTRLTPDYVQSARILGCYSVHHKRFFTAPRVYDFVMDNTFLDAAVDGILVDFGALGQSVYGMRITDSAIQSQSGIGVSVGGATGMVIEQNYWENCGREFVAIHSGTTVNYGGSIQNNFIQPKAVPPVERLAAFDLGGCSSSGFKLGGNVSQDQNLYNFSSSALGYFDTTNDRSAVTAATLFDPVTRPSTVRAILNISQRWGLLWGTNGGMFLNPISRGIEYTHSEYDYVDPTDNVRIPIVRGMAVIAPAGFGGGLDNLGVSPAQASSLYTQKAWAAGSFLGNPTASATANASNVVEGFQCVTSGRPGVWVECHTLTKRGTDILTVDGPNNRVGINTVAPTVPLQVTGASRFYGNGSFSIGWGDSSDLGRLSRVGSVPNISGLTNGLDINTTASVPITITTNSAERARWDGAGNLLVGGTLTPTSARAAVVISNGAAPTASVADGVALYAEDVAASSELKVRDEAGNVTTLSPHNFSLIPGGQSEEMAWAYYSERNGKRINVDMLKLARLVEQVTGEKLVFEG